MNLSKASLLLDKINNLNNSLEKSGISISSIERDLMLSYIRQLYECYLDEMPSQPLPKQQEEFPHEATPPRKEVKRDAYKPPRIIEIPDAIEEEIEEPAPPPPPRKMEMETVRTNPTPPKPTVEMSDEVAVLFEQKAASDLSEKLSKSPISDLTKAIALNDKLLYSNQLFGGALVSFNEVIRTLNNMSSFNEAEQYLMQLATQHNWTTQGNQEVAKSLIKLVRRRFI